MSENIIGTSATIKEDKDFFIEFITTFVKRAGVERLIAWLATESKSDFFTAPASTKYNLAIKGGLVKHAVNRLNVFCKKLANKPAKDILQEFKKRYSEVTEDSIQEYSKEILNTEEYALDTVAILGLLADASKANCFVLDVKQVKDPDTQKWEPTEYWKWEEKFLYSTRGTKTVYVLQQFIPLFMEEAQALAFVAAGETIQFSTTLDTTYRAIYEQSLLAVYLHTAELESCYVEDRAFEVVS